MGLYTTGYLALRVSVADTTREVRGPQTSPTSGLRTLRLSGQTAKFSVTHLQHAYGGNRRLD